MTTTDYETKLRQALGDELILNTDVLADLHIAWI